MNDLKNIFININEVPEEKGKIFLIHGLGEHSERYRKFIEFMNEKKYSVISPDLPGFGKSPGKRGHIEGFNIYYSIIEKIIEKYGNDSNIILGHSMGGLIAARFTQTTRHKIKALVVSGAATKMKKIPAFLSIITKLLDVIAPSVVFSNRIDANDLSYNEESNKAYVNDPLVHDKISARLFWEMKRESNKLYKNIEKIQIPVLIIHGKDDPLVNPSFSTDFFNSLLTKQKELKFIENAKHESMNEKNGEKAYSIIYNFLEKVKNES